MSDFYLGTYVGMYYAGEKKMRLDGLGVGVFVT